MQTEEKVVEVDKTVLSQPVIAVEEVNSEDAQALATHTLDDNTVKQLDEVLQGELTSSLKENIASENSESVPKLNDESLLEDSGLPLQSVNTSVEAASDKTASLFSLYVHVHKLRVGPSDFILFLCLGKGSVGWDFPEMCQIGGPTILLLGLPFSPSMLEMLLYVVS